MAFVLAFLLSFLMTPPDMQGQGAGLSGGVCQNEVSGPDPELNPPEEDCEPDGYNPCTYGCAG